MIDISDKRSTPRSAVAQAVLEVDAASIEAIHRGAVPKGDPLAVAKVAAVQAAKNAGQTIPYCHPLPLDYVGVDFKMGPASITIMVTVKAHYRTGVEMEALAGAAAGGLTVYDMLKVFDQRMSLTVELLSKRGGKSDFDAAQPGAEVR